MRYRIVALTLTLTLTPFAPAKDADPADPADATADIVGGLAQAWRGCRALLATNDRTPCPRGRPQVAFDEWDGSRDVLDNLARLERARTLLEIGDRQRSAGDLWGATRTFQQIESLCPGSRYAQLAESRRSEPWPTVVAQTAATARAADPLATNLLDRVQAMLLGNAAIVAGPTDIAPMPLASGGEEQELRTLEIEVAPLPKRLVVVDESEVGDATIGVCLEIVASQGLRVRCAWSMGGFELRLPAGTDDGPSVRMWRAPDNP